MFRKGHQVLLKNTKPSNRGVCTFLLLAILDKLRVFLLSTSIEKNKSEDEFSNYTFQSIINVFFCFFLSNMFFN